MLLKRQERASSGPDPRLDVQRWPVHPWPQNKLAAVDRESQHRKAPAGAPEPARTASTAWIAAKDQHVLQTCRQSERHITQGDASKCVQPSWRDGQGSSINKTAQCTAQEGASWYVGTCLRDDPEHLASTDEPQRVACTLSKVAWCAPKEGAHERVGSSRHSTQSLKGL